MSNQPFKKCRNGRFQISLFRNEKTIPVPEDDHYGCERTRTWFRVCVQYSQFVDGEWERQQIWCAPEELRDLSDALDRLTTGEPSEDE